MGKAFFDQVDDEFRGLIGPARRGYEGWRSGHLLQLWYGDPHAHFEVQMVSRRWSPSRDPVVEVGLHLEYPHAQTNQQIVEQLLAVEASWRSALPAAEVGPAIGPRAALWRRVSELLAETVPDDPDLASEAAELLAVYVRALQPLLEAMSTR